MSSSPESITPAASRVSRRWMRAAALVLAVTAWFLIRETISQETVVYDIPVQFLHEPGYAVLDRSVDTVDVRFRGSRGDLAVLKPDEIKMVVDVRDVQESGTRVKIKLRPPMIRAPGAARPIAIAPGEIVLSTDREGGLDIPVRAELQDQPPEGFSVERFVCDPATVRLSGPMSKLREVDALTTGPIGLEGRTRSFKTRASVLPPQGLPTARVEPERVQVEVVITEHAATRVFDRIPVRLMSASVGPQWPRVTVTPATVAVTLQGKESALNAIEPDAVRAFVDCSGLNLGGKYELPVQWVVPPGVRAVQTDPSAVTIGVSE